MKREREKGQAILEAAIMFPVFALLAMGIIDVQFSLEKVANLEYIVNETARCQAIAGPACSVAPNTPNNYAFLLAQNLAMHTADLTMLSWGCDEYTCTTVMSYRYHALGAWFPSITMKRTGMASLPAK